MLSTAPLKRLQPGSHIYVLNRGLVSLLIASHHLAQKIHTELLRKIYKYDQLQFKLYNITFRLPDDLSLLRNPCIQEDLQIILSNASHVCEKVEKVSQTFSSWPIDLPALAEVLILVWILFPYPTETHYLIIIYHIKHLLLILTSIEFFFLGVGGVCPPLSTFLPSIFIEIFTTFGEKRNCLYV